MCNVHIEKSVELEKRNILIHTVAVLTREGFLSQELTDQKNNPAIVYAHGGGMKTSKNEL